MVQLIISKKLTLDFLTSLIIFLLTKCYFKKLFFDEYKYKIIKKVKLNRFFFKFTNNIKELKNKFMLFFRFFSEKNCFTLTTYFQYKA